MKLYQAAADQACAESSSRNNILNKKAQSLRKKEIRDYVST